MAGGRPRVPSAHRRGRAGGARRPRPGHGALPAGDRRGARPRRRGAATLPRRRRLAPPVAAPIGAECPECGASQSVDFDVQGFLLARILGERSGCGGRSHQIAATYHWSRADILGLGRTRAGDVRRRRVGRGAQDAGPMSDYFARAAARADPSPPPQRPAPPAPAVEVGGLAGRGGGLRGRGRGPMTRRPRQAPPIVEPRPATVAVCRRGTRRHGGRNVTAWCRPTGRGACGTRPGPGGPSGPPETEDPVGWPVPRTRRAATTWSPTTGRPGPVVGVEAHRPRLRPLARGRWIPPANPGDPLALADAVMLGVFEPPATARTSPPSCGGRCPGGRLAGAGHGRHRPADRRARRRPARGARSGAGEVDPAPGGPARFGRRFDSGWGW